MQVVRIVGQPPKLRQSSTGDYICVVSDGFVLLDTVQYLTCDEGGGFEDTAIPHSFRLVGTRVKRIRNCSPYQYSITEFHIPGGMGGS